MIEKVSIDTLLSGFESVPDAARPRVWWHWMNGNITREGIEKDLQWMKRIGVGGLQHFDGALETPQVVEERLAYMTPKWQEAFCYATRRAEELGLEFAIASSPGWSETGGPWVEPKDGMKKLVWSDARLKGGSRFAGKLAAPPSIAGPFQDIPIVDVLSGEEKQSPSFYRDVAVIAYRTPEALLEEPKPVGRRTSPLVGSQCNVESDDGQLLTLSLGEDTPAWVLYDYGQPARFSAVTLARQVPFSLEASVSFTVEASLDGERFDHVADFPAEWHPSPVTLAFPAVIARYIRVKGVLGPAVLWAGFRFGSNSPGAILPPMYRHEIREVKIHTLKFHAGARVHRFESKAGFSIAANYLGLECAPNAMNEATDPKEVVDLTNEMRPDGTLNWTPPEGHWTVLRLGYSLTGKTNHPASVEATGLEVDKLDKAAVRAYMERYLLNFEKTVGKDWIGKKGIRAFLTDSIESAGQNWTREMMREFKTRRGYDLTRWFPALTGVIVGDSSRTDRFLWDYRKTLIELIAEAHYGEIARSVHERGMLYYSESLEGYPAAALGDDLDMRAPADIPMAAVWTSYRLEEEAGIINHVIDMIGAASVAHFYGKRFVGCESMTSANEPWAFSPQRLKPYMDLAFALGINRPLIHTSVHQPTEHSPGMTLGCFGQHFTRHETWGAMAGPWISYLARCSYLLQQGACVSDIAWFYGEEGSAANLVSRVALRDFPRRYGFDLVSPKMLTEQLNANDSRLVSPGGATYRLLYLGGSSAQMTLPVLRRIRALANQGIAIAGLRPKGSPSLADEANKNEYEQLVRELWDGGSRVIENDDPEAVLQRLGVIPDFECESADSDSDVRFSHRKLDSGELYFLTNRRARKETVKLRFRVTGYRPELWHADTGAREAVSWWVEKDRTVIPLELTAYHSVFVVFREATCEVVQEVTAVSDSTVVSLDGEWTLSFERGRGAPAQTLSTALGSWSESSDAGIRFFSGIGTYKKTFTFPHAEAATRIILDLGTLHELAEVVINGRLIGTTWHAPFRLDVTDAIRMGPNTIEIRVANLWVNRLIGDQQPGATPVAFTVTETYKPDAPLRPSGLLGPVTLVRRKLK